MRQLWLSLLCSGLIFSATAQTLQPTLSSVDLPLSAVPALELPAQDNKQLRAAELERRGPGIAPRFAEAIPADVSPVTHGLWQVGKDGRHVWRLRVPSPGAHSINLGFDFFDLPPTAELLLYSMEEGRAYGPFSPADNEEHGELWTPVIPGDELLIELSVAPEYRLDVLLHLKTVNHDFIGFHASVLSGSCNLDVICGATDGFGIVDNYRDIIQSVAVYSTGGNTFCTGFLVNNARQDCTPYFITAAHCGVGFNSAPSLVVYWNYVNSFCRQPGTPQSGQPGNGSLTDFNTGAIHRATFGGGGVNQGDMTLVELDDPVSETANAYYAGWDVTNDDQRDTVIAVHHPNTDEKRISFEFGTTFATNYLGDVPNANGSHLRVPDWDIGTTEGGSSGSPLFTASGHAIGILSGGGAACGNNEPDWYGWLHRSWTGGGTPTTRLRDWLDPDDTGVTVLDGRWNEACLITVSPDVSLQAICAPQQAVFQLSASENFQGPVTLGATSLPAGLNATFSQPTVAPGGSATLTISGTGNLTSGTYSFQLTGTDGANNSSETLTLQISNGLPSAPSAATPANNATDLPLTVNFTWTLLANASSYDLQVSTTSNFSNLLLNETGLVDPALMFTVPTVSTTYYWRVRAHNTCGVGPWSSTFSFTTADIACATLAANDVPVIINDGPAASYTSTLTVNIPGSISSLRLVNLDITHSYVGDLQATLTSPQGTSVQLFAPSLDGDCDGGNLLVTFDDAATNSAIDFINTCGFGDPAISGDFQPLESLGAFAGEMASGVWTLTVNDNAFFDGGAINGWQLDFCTTVPAVASLAPSADIINSCEEVNASFDLTLGIGFAETGVNLEVTGLPTGVSANFSANPAQPGSTVTVTLSGTATTGDFPITVSGNDGNHQAEAGLSLVVISTPPIPSLDYPADGAVDVMLNDLLTWLPVGESTSYRITIATDPNLTQIVESANATGPSHASSMLDFATTYYWTVNAENDCGVSAPAPVRSFTTIPDIRLTLLNGFEAVCLSETATFQLEVGPAFGDDFTVNVSPAPGLTINNVEENFNSVTRILTLNLSGFVGMPTGYPIGIQITGAGGAYTNTTEVSLSIVTSPGLTSLLGPADESTVVAGGNVTLSWLLTANTDEYTVQVATDEAFNNIIFTHTTSGQAVQFAPPAEGLYYWRVVTSNACGDATTAPFTFSYLMTGTREIAGVGWTLLPNPSRDQAYLRLEGSLSGELSVLLYHPNGQQLRRWTFPASAGLHPLEVSDLPAGVYLLRLQAGGAQVTARLIHL